MVSFSIASPVIKITFLAKGLELFCNCLYISIPLIPSSLISSRITPSPHYRAFHRILKIAHTIADLESGDIIKAHHVAEAIQYRPRRMV